MYGRSYVFRRSVTTIAADRPFLQIQAPSNASIVLLRAWLNQNSIEVSEQVGVRLTRKSAASAVTAAVIATDILPLDSDDAAATVQVGASATGYQGTSAGTNSAVLIQEGFNVVGNGWLYLPVPEERITVPAGGIIALEAVTAFSMTVEAGIAFLEI